MMASVQPCQDLRSTGPQLGAVLEFMRLMWAVDHALQRTSKRMRVRLGVTGPQRLVIRVVSRFPGIPAGQLSDLLHLHPSTVTGILNRLKEQGLVARRVDPRDRRRVLLGLTRKGRQLDIATEDTVEDAVRVALSTVSEQEIRSAGEVLGKICASLQNTAGVGAPEGLARVAKPK
jgi:MarR family transcriptional regulator, organic hydroperoxide resistance regulator